MGDVDHRGRQLPVQVRDLDPRVHPQRRVEVRQGFVEQKQLRLAHDGPPDGDPLALAARKLRGVAVQIGIEVQHPRGIGDPLLDHLLRLAFLTQCQRHVLAHVQMRVKRVGLKHHRDAALRGRGPVDDVAGDAHIARGRILQPRDDAQERGLAAARRADENHEFAVLDAQADVFQDVDGAEGLAHMGQGQGGHCTGSLDETGRRGVAGTVISPPPR